MATKEKKSKVKDEKVEVREELIKELEKDLESKDEELAKLKEDFEKQTEKTEEYISFSQRLQADFENFKKQNEKKNADIIKFANENLIINILDSYEDLERALEKSTNEEELREGVELIYNKLKDTLTKEGLEEIPTEGKKFDPFKHEALMAVKDDDIENRYIVDELMKGYTLKEKVIKYSKVIVCKK
ncbi:MAG: nucleotide exchange factor GrpE [archaeon]|nr:nucleotide exchange factor GrpE [archaeon]